ncbi:MAG: AAA domain-containing protein [Candidatus Berkelbacteria bacterium]
MEKNKIANTIEESFDTEDEKATSSTTTKIPEKFSQIKFDKSFIKKLLDKLKVGNARSIHLNAVPGRSATRLDLHQLSEIDPEMPLDFIKTILNKESFSFSISFDKIDLGELEDSEKKKLVLISKRLNALVIEKEDNFLEFGLKNFGFGYPILIKRDQNDPTKIIKAPLFIWHLDIERSYQNKNNWTIKKDEDSPIKINEILISHLSKDESVKIEKISQEILEDGILDETELLEMSSNILSQLNSKVDNLSIRIDKCPDSKEIEAIANSKPWIQWSGIFGIYRSQNETIIHSTEELLERFDEFESEKLVLEQFQTSSISAVETDPSKEEIVNTLTKDEIKLIQGPPGTGKSQSITAIVSNALANNAKCLIVCEKKTALDVINENLKKIGLDSYSILIDDVNKDRKKVIQKARDIKESPYYPSFARKDFEIKYEKFCELKNDINLKSAETLQKVLGDISWKQLVGLYLKFSKSGDIDKIASEINYSQLKFDHQEYSDYLAMVEESVFLFDDLEKNSEEVFSLLRDTSFLTPYRSTDKENLKDEIEIISQIAKSSEQFLIKNAQSGFEEKGISLFKPKSIVKCKLQLSELKQALKEIIDLYEAGIKLVGDEFNKKGLVQNVRYQVSALFGTKHKKIYAIRRKIPTLLKNATQIISELEKFGFGNLSLKKFEAHESCKSLKNNSIDTLGEVKKIESKIDQIKKNEDELISIYKKLMESAEKKIFDLDIKSYISLGNRAQLVKFFKDMGDVIENVRCHLDAYESYHNWKYFCSNKNSLELQILSALKDSPPENWRNIFIAWYYRGTLQNYENTTKVGFHKSNSKLQQLSGVYNELCDSQIQQIKSNWGNSRSYQISKIDYNFNTLFSLRKNNAGPKSSLRKIIDKDFDLFTTLFPVILTNPAAANAIFPLTQGLFNIVIFDEASQLRISDTFTSLIRGQYKIIAGDEHQMPPSSYFQSTAELLDNPEGEEIESTADEDEQAVLAESESLLQYASDLKNVNKSYLDFHYRSNHPALIDFSNCAFYGGNLVPFPPQEIYTPIEFRAINGRYETRTNPSEVIEIIKIIKNEIHADQKGKYPSVGIATFNINQRNLITEALNEWAEKDPSFGRKLLELRECGLFVKNLENIQGDEKDIIIISTTYGIQEDGSFSQNFARLNRIEGYKLLNVLITRAKHKLYVCTSIPKEKYLSYADIIQNEGNNKKGILYAYLAYAEAVSSHNTESAEGILRTLKEYSYEKPRIISNSDGLSESPFEEEVYEMLCDQFKAENVIQQHKIGGFRLDFVIKAKSTDIVLECDGKAYHQSEEAYAHDMYRQKELEKLGFVVYRIWSTNWFQDKEIEMQKLVRFVESKSQ